MEKRLRLSDNDQALLTAALTDYAQKHPDQGPVSSMLMARLTGSSPPDGTVLSHQVPSANSPTPSIEVVQNGEGLTDKSDLATVETVHEDTPAVKPPAVDMASVLEPVLAVPASSPVPVLTVPVHPPVPAQIPRPVQVPTPESLTREEMVRAWRAWRMERRAWILEEARVVNMIWAGFTNRKERTRRLTPLQQQLQLLESTVDPPPGWTPLTRYTP